MSEDFSSDSVTEVTTTGWLQRVGQSILGALIGVLLVIGSIILLWWNEGRADDEIRALDQCAQQTVEENARAIDPANNEMIVTPPGRLATNIPYRDGPL